MAPRLPSNPARNFYVSKTGRALSPGKVTRKSLTVSRHVRKGTKRPLPMELQCHPKALTRTPHNPLCRTVIMPYGGMLKQFDSWTYSDFVRGRGLSPDCQVRGYVVRTTQGKDLGRIPDIRYAMAWRIAAVNAGVGVEIWES